MFKKSMAILVASLGLFSSQMALAQTTTTTTYGYQCFSMMDGTQHCSCTNFADSGSAYDWMFQRLATLQSGNADAKMVSHSDTTSQTQAANCEN